MLFENDDLHLSVRGACLVPCSTFLIDKEGIKAFGIAVFLKKVMWWGRFTELWLMNRSAARTGSFKYKYEIFTKAGVFRNQEKGVQLTSWVWHLSVKPFLSLRIRSLGKRMQQGTGQVFLFNIASRIIKKNVSF